MTNCFHFYLLGGVESLFVAPVVLKRNYFEPFLRWNNAKKLKIDNRFFLVITIDNIDA